MKEIKNIEIDNEKIYLKKSNFFGWGVVYPWRNEDGSINWFNLLTGGAWAKLILVALIVFLIVVLMFEYVNNINNLISCFEDILKLQTCIDLFNPDLSISYVS